MGNPFASQTQETVALPFDPPQTVTVRKLTGRECDEARQAHRDGLAGGSVRLWPATFRRALEKGATDPEVLRAIADPLTGYDRFAIVRAGLIAWTYPAKCTKEAIDDLDDEAVDFLAAAILRLTKPHLFLEPGEDAAEKKSA